MRKPFSRLGQPETLAEAIDNLVALPVSSDARKVHEGWEAMRGYAHKSPTQDVEDAMRRLVAALSTRQPTDNWPFVYALGILVEIKGDSAIAGNAVFEQSKPLLALIAPYYDAMNTACARAAAAAGGGLTQAQLDALIGPINAQMPLARASDRSFILYAKALLAYLTRNKELRKHTRLDRLFVEDTKMLRQFPEEIGWLNLVMETLDDEEILVLYPQHRKGFLVRISGITHNFQLHTLLADKIMGSHIPGERPDPRVVAASKDKPWDATTPVAKGSFQLHDWTAIEADGSVCANPMERLVWHEGSPQDIPAFQGKRVIVLTPPPFERTWRAPRDLEGEHLDGELELVKVLTPAQCGSALQRLAAAPKPATPKVSLAPVPTEAVKPTPKSGTRYH